MSEELERTHTWSDRPRLGVVLASTRPGRVGEPVAQWFEEVADRHGELEVDLIDLAAVGLPFLDEPEHPRLRRYSKPHTWEWSARVEAKDAFVFVMPEYNHGFNAPLKNALDFLHGEWQHKPVGFVTYGGVAGGTRAQQLLKPVLVPLKMVALSEAVTIPFVRQRIGDDGSFAADDRLERAANTLLDALTRWTRTLSELRSRSSTGE